MEHVTRTHQGRRARNEDAVLARPGKGLWAVADGMGGHELGDYASALLMEALDASSAQGDLEARSGAARMAIERANRQLYAMGQGRQAGRTVGSTIVALLTDASRFVCLWAGDSRAYLAHGGTLAQITRDHSLVQRLVDAGQITPTEALSHPDGHIVTRAAGAAARIEIDRCDGVIAPGDAFLLATDGLTRLMTDDELAERLGAADLEAAADRLVQTCLERGAPDNVSFVILRGRTGD
jgi:serine/threonine protein phosphatase Stp1